MSLPVRSPPFKLAVCLLFMIITIYSLSRRGTDSSHLDLDGMYSSADDFYDRIVYGNKAAFVEDVLQTEIDGSFDHTAIKELCSRKKWNEGLIFECKAPQGGIGNVRNIFLNCVRYAMEAGASFIVPQIMAKGIELGDPQSEKLVDLSYYFDTEYFTNSLALACPQMQLYSSVNDLWNFPSTAAPLDLSPQDLSKSFIHDTVMETPKEWYPSFRSWLNGSTKPAFKTSKEIPTRVILYEPLLQFPLSYDSGDFVANIGRILRFREDIRRIAATVLFALNEKYELNLDPDKGIAPEKFYGAHLSTGDDVAAGWTTHEDQSQNYLQEAQQKKLSLIYVTSSSPSDTTVFTGIARSPKYNISTETKTHLLSASAFAAESAGLKALTLDQQALVDYEVLLRASWFGGIKESTFSWNIAMRRHVLDSRGTWVGVEKMRKANGGAGQTFRDGLSTVFGGVGEFSFMGASVWP